MVVVVAVDMMDQLIQMRLAEMVVLVAVAAFG
jgi:hypothetical protein